MLSLSRPLVGAASLAAVLVPGLAAGPALPAEAAPVAGAAQQAAPPVPRKVVQQMVADNTSKPDFQLKWAGDKYGTQISNLRTNLKFKNPKYKYTNMTALMKAAPRKTVQRCPEATAPETKSPKKPPGALTDGVNPVDWFCLNKTDSTTGSWSPQGMSGTWDAHPGGTVNKQHVIAFTWHFTKNNRSRVSFLNDDPTGNHQYAHVLLVVTTKNGADYTNMPIHAGGLVWYHQYLLVASDSHNKGFNPGIYVFNLHNLISLGQSTVGDVKKSKLIGAHPCSGSPTKTCYYAYGYHYILPLVGVWTPNTAYTACAAQSPHPCYSYAGLDRSNSSSPILLTGEWCDTRTATKCTVGRVANFKMETTANCVHGCLQTGKNGLAEPYQVYTQPSPYMQGGISWKGTYYFTESHCGHSFGTLFPSDPATNRYPRSYAAGIGVQDLYWRRAKPRELWSLTEFKGIGRRVLYGINPPSA